MRKPVIRAAVTTWRRWTDYSKPEVRKKHTVGGIIAMVVIGLVATAWPAGAPLQGIAQGEGMLFYGEGTVTTPKYNVFTNNQFGAEATGVAAAATIRHTVVKAAPNGGGRNELIAGVQTTGGVLYIQRWNGTTWSNEWNVTVGNSNLPRFDIAYEQTSGRAVVVYSGNIAALNELQYRTYNGSSWSNAANLDAVRTTGAADAIQLEPRSGSNEIGLAWADNLWDLSGNFWDAAANAGAGGWVGEPAAALSANLSRVGAPAACLTNATCMTTWSFDLAFESTSGELVVGWGTEATTDPTFRKRTAGTGGAWAAANVAGTAAVEEATDMEMTADPNSNHIGYANITGEVTATAASPDLEGGMWNGDTDVYGNNDNIDVAAGLVESGTNNVSGAWVRNGTTDVFVLMYDDAAAAVNFRYFNKGTSAWAAGTDFTGATAPAAAQKLLRSRSNPFDASKLMLTIVDSASDVFTKELTYGGGTTFTWVSRGPSNGTAAHELTGSSITGMSADYAYYKYIPPPVFEQSAYRWFANVDGPAAFGTGGVAVPNPSSSRGVDITTDSTYMYALSTNDVNGGWLEKRDLATGALDTNFANGGLTIAPTGIVNDGTYLYISGFSSATVGVIQKRLMSTGALDTNFGVGGTLTAGAASDYFFDIAVDSSYVYVVGRDSALNASIEKRSKTSGAVDNNFAGDGVLDGVAATQQFAGISIDSTWMYVVGIDASTNWRIEKRSLATGAVDTNFDGDGIVDGVTASEDGQAITIDSSYMYVVGRNDSLNIRTEKRSLATGAVDNNFGASGIVDGDTASNYLMDVAVDSSYIYVVGYDSVPDWRIEKRSLATGAVDNNFGASGIITGAANSQDSYGMGIDATYMYVVGSEVSGNLRIEKRSLGSGGLAAGAEVGSPLAAANTAATAPAQGTPFRLRMNLHVSGNDLAASGQLFRLQYAGKGAGTCESPAGTPSTYSNVNTTSAIRYYDNSIPADDTSFTASADDPTHGADTILRQKYEELNTFTNSASAINIGQDGMWDFALTDNNAPASTTYCFRVLKNDGSALTTYSQDAQITTAATAGGPSTSSDIVDASGTSVTSPSFSMASTSLSFACQTSSGTLGADAQRLRVSNGATAENWNLSIAASGGATSTWATSAYDYNDSAGSPAGCTDGADADTVGGKMTLNPASGTLAPKSGCTNTGVTKGASTAFAQGTQDTITLLSGTTSTGTNCHWDLTGVPVDQLIPAEQPVGSYTINLTMTLTAT